MVCKETVKGELGARFDKYLTRITPFGFSGALLAAKENEIILNKGYGMAIREKGIRNTAQTVFSIGSLTKQFTAAAILKLEMQGKLNTNDHVSKYIDNVPKDKDSITIHHLLTHTAGMINYTGEDYEVAYRDETIQKILDSPLLFSPGKHYKYSNAGYSLLAVIIEIVSGRPYEEYLNQHLFKPAGMAFTGYRIPNWNERVVANWYIRETNNRTHLEKPYPYWNLIGNGGILSTTEDMYKWYIALKNDTVLSTESKKKLFTPFLKNYAYGWDVSKTEHGTRIHHDGANDLGSSADFRWFVDCDVVIVLFCNQSYGESPLMSQVRDKIEKLAFGEDVALPSAILKTNPSALRRFEGKYKLPTGGHLILSTETDALKLTAKGQDAINVIFSPKQDKPFHPSDLNYRAKRLFEATTRGDYSYCKKELEDKERVERWRRLIISALNKGELRGSAKEIKVIGTLPFPRKEDTIETIVQLKCNKENIAFGLLWREGKLWGMTTEPDSLFMLFMPVSEQMFVGYHLGLAKNLSVSFNFDNSGFVNGLTIYKKDSNVIAQRVEIAKKNQQH